MAKNKKATQDTASAADAGPDTPAEAPKADNSISVTSKKTNRDVTLERDFGKDLDAMVAAFGADVVHANAQAMFVIKCQAAVRGVLNAPDKSPEDAIKAGQEYTPGVIRRGGGGKKKDPADQLAEKVLSGEMSMDDLQALIAKRVAAQKEAAAAA